MFLNYMFFVAIIIVLANIYPYMYYTPHNVSELVINLVFSSFFIIVYLLLKYVFIAIIGLQHKRTIISMKTVFKIILKLRLLIVILIIVVSMSNLIPIISAIYYGSMVSNVFVNMYSITFYLVSLGVEYILAPFIMLKNIFNKNISLLDILIILGLPWIIITFTATIVVDNFIALIFGIKAIFVYYRGWGDENMNILSRNGAISMFLPTYGELLSVLFIALYTRRVIRVYL